MANKPVKENINISTTIKNFPQYLITTIILISQCKKTMFSLLNCKTTKHIK